MAMAGCEECPDVTSMIDDGNNGTVADDGSDDDDDTYYANDLEIFADGPSSSTHNKKSDKTKWCEREVLKSCEKKLLANTIDADNTNQSDCMIDSCGETRRSGLSPLILLSSSS